MRVCLALVLMALTVAAQSVGPDVIVGDITTPDNYGSVNGISSFAVGTTSCNIGNQVLQWQANNAQHPVIGQTMYRLLDGRFEQIGTAWLKHGFYALQNSLCQTCIPHPNGSALGVGCSDPYTASLNGSQSGLGARSEVNAATGAYPYPPVLNPPITNLLDRRLQAANTDLNPTQNPGALYFVEAQYVALDDSAAGNDNNNASWRRVLVTPFGSGFAISETGPTAQAQSAIYAWQANDPSVVIQNVDVSGDGRFEVGVKVTNLSGGFKQFEFAIHNLNSDRSLGNFTLNFPAGTSVSNIGFHDINYHSGEPYSGTDWTSTTNPAGGTVTWSTVPYATNVNANALRWGHTYNFRCRAQTMPSGYLLGLFKPGTPSNISMAMPSMPVPTWQENSLDASMSIDGATNTGFTGPVSVTRTANSTSVLNISSIHTGSVWELVLVPAPAVPNAGLFPIGQILNLSLGNPNAILVNNMFQTPWLLGSWNTALSAPPIPMTLSAQFAIVNPQIPGSLALSAANEMTVIPCNNNSMPLVLGDDDSVSVALGGPNFCNAQQVNFYGTSYTSLYVNSNGSVGFLQGSADFSPTATAFTSQMPRLAGHWSDLEPNVAGTITASSTAAGLFKVSYVNVPEWGTNNAATCTFDLTFDTVGGGCSIQNYSHGGNTWASDTLVGISPGVTAITSSVNFSSFLNLGAQNGNAGRAIYQLSPGAAPMGFSSISFPQGNGASFLVQ